MKRMRKRKRKSEEEEEGEGEELQGEALRKLKRAKVVTSEVGEEKQVKEELKRGSSDGESQGYLDSGKSHAKAAGWKDSSFKIEKEGCDPWYMLKMKKIRSYRGIRTNKPKRPLSAYMAFKGEFRKKFEEENPSNNSVTTVSIAAVEKWKQLSDADKAPYVAEAQKRMAEYLKNLVAYSK